MKIDNLENLTLKKVLKINKIVGNKFGTESGFLNKGMLSLSLEGDGPYEVAKNIVKNHPFIDANKRTAIALYIMLKSDKTLEEVVEDFEDIFKNLA